MSVEISTEPRPIYVSITRSFLFALILGAAIEEMVQRGELPPWER